MSSQPVFAAHDYAVVPNYSTSVTTKAQQQLERLAAVSDLMLRTCAASDVDEGCQFLANELRGYLECDLVLVGVVTSGTSRCRLAGSAMRGNEQLGEDALRSAEAALQEAAFDEQVSQWPTEGESPRHGMLARQKFALGVAGAGLCTIPLQDGRGVLHGVVILAGLSMECEPSEAIAFVQAGSVAIAESLRLLQRTQPSRISKAWYTTKNKVLAWPRRSIAIGSLIVLLLLLIPVPYRVRSKCRLEPVVKRFIAAPFDAILEESLVQPGDLVSAGQPLARLEGKDLHLELEETSAELHQATKERAGYVASHDSGKAKLSELEIRKWESKLQMLQDRTSNLIVECPLDGVVVSGDLKSDAGRPLKVGQVLFEIAPLNRMTVEVLIPESEILYVEPGMQVKLEIDAFPFRTFSGAIAQIHPRGELIENEQVFVAELEIENPLGDLRPGMHGRARVIGPRYPWIWNWIRNPLAGIGRFLGY